MRRISTIGVVRLIVLTSWLAASGVARAGNIPFQSADEQAGFNVIVGRGALSGQNSGDIGGGEAWPRTGTLTESEGGTFSNDKVFVENGTAFHDKAPHGEPSNAGNVFQFSFSFIADGFSNRTESSKNGGAKRFEHKKGSQTHYDHYLATASARIVAHNAIGGDIKSWGMVVRGIHTESTTHDFEGTVANAAITGGGGDNDAVGSLVAFLDDETNVLDLTIGIGGMPISNFTGAQLREGSIGQDGPVVMDLGSAGLWDDLDGQGIGRGLAQAFPTQYLSSLLAGNMYVQINSLSFPDGALRAQLDPVEETLVPEPMSFMLLLIGATTMIVVYRRVR
jgi:CHRD domain